MPPRLDPEEIMKTNMAQMAQAMMEMTRLMTQQYTTSVAQAVANAQKDAAENERQAHRQ